MPSDTYILTISDAGVSVPSSHASTHITGGSDVIPTATSSTSGLMSAAIFNQHVTNTAKVENKIHTGDVTDAAGVLTVNKINGVALAPLGTGILRLASGVPSIATEAQFPTLNQSTTGNANTATTATNLAGGGVGQVPYQTGSGATAMLAAGTAGYVLKSNGSAAPSWAPVDLSAGISGSLPVASGGTGAATFTAGVLKANGTSSFTTVPAPAGNLVGTSDTQTLTNKTLTSPTISGGTISGGTISGGTISSLSSPIAVASGGTGAATLTGYVKGTGTTAMTADATVPVADLTGTLPVAKGGTGVATLTGIVKANGTGAFTSVTEPAGDLVGTTATQTLTNKIFGTGTVIGTPTSGILTNCTGLPISGLVSSTSTALGVGSIELGHATDTTISRVSAGRIAVEGVNVVTASSTDTLTNKTLVTPVLGTPTSGTLTSCTGLPISGLVSSTSTALGVGSIELGHATDTTISRVSAGRIAVEGVNVVTASSTDTLTNKTLVTPVLGTPAAGSILTNCTGLPLTAGVTGTLPVANGGTGVTQSAYAESYISTSAATTYSDDNTWYKISGSTSLTTGENFDDAGGTNNRIRYTGTANRAFFITVCGTVTGSNGNTILVGLYVSGAHVDASITAVTISGTLRHQFSSQAIVFLDTNDYIEVHTQNQSSTNNATFERLSICAHALV
jgi:hypothetical protein